MSRSQVASDVFLICRSGTASLWYVPVVRHLYDIFQWSGIYMICPSGPASSWYVPVVRHLYYMSQWSGIFMICPSGPASLWYVPVVRHLHDMSQWSGIFMICPSVPTYTHTRLPCTRLTTTQYALPASLPSLLARQQFCTTNTSFLRQEIHLQTFSYSHYRKHSASSLQKSNS